MDSLEVSDKEEKYFSISDNLELIENRGLFHLLSPEGYIIFDDIRIFSKVDTNYLAYQDENEITVNEEEYGMIVKAVEMCKESA